MIDTVFEDKNCSTKTTSSMKQFTVTKSTFEQLVSGHQHTGIIVERSKNTYIEPD